MLNADHSMAPFLADLVATGRMTEEEAARDPSRHSLRSAVMGDDIHLIDVSSQPVAVRKGDRLLLASDGLMTLSDQEIAEILRKTQDAPLEDSAAALIQAVEAAEHPYQDNTTVLLYAPAEGRELAAAADGEGEYARGKPRFKGWAGRFGMLLCAILLVAIFLAVQNRLGRGQNVAVETPAISDVEPTGGSDIQPMDSDPEEGEPASQEEVARDSIGVGVEKGVANEPPEESVGGEGESARGVVAKKKTRPIMSEPHSGGRVLNSVMKDDA